MAEESIVGAYNYSLDSEEEVAINIKYEVRGEERLELGGFRGDDKQSCASAHLYRV